MIINKNNGNILNTKDIYVHDDIFISLEFKNDNKMMLLKLKKYSNKRNYDIVLKDIIGFEMSACDFWGKSECVFDFEYVEPQEHLLIPKLKKRWENEAKLSYDIFNNCIEVIITFTSGNELRVACASIEIKTGNKTGKVRQGGLT